MKSKALIIGALPIPFTGPWVHLESDREWQIRGLRDGIRIEKRNGKMRAIIEKELETKERVNVFAVG